MHQSPSDAAAQDQIQRNIEIHNRIAHEYDRGHGEIFNETEQARLKEELRTALGEVRSGAEHLTALDFGCGSGNLTRQLLDLGCSVTSADVSEDFLKLVRGRFDGQALSTVQLNGKDLSNIASDTFDVVATYSVLHHIPDYLASIREMARVCRPGGIVFIDHEMAEHYWTPSDTYKAFVAEASTFNWRKFLEPKNYYGKIRRMFFDPKYAPEGDIHVWPDDHIEWSKIEAMMGELNFEVVASKDYLLYRSGYRPEVFEAYQSRCSDMRLMVFRKAQR